MKLRAVNDEAAPRQSIAARYLAACLRWQHEHGAKASAVPQVAKELLHEMGSHAN